MFDLEEADRSARRRPARRELFFAINFNHRYARPVQMAHDAIASGTLGPISFATWRFGGEVGTSTHPHANLIETQCHGFDMLEHLCGPIAVGERPHARPERTRGYTHDGRGADVRVGCGRLHSSGPTTRRTPTPRPTTSRSTASLGRVQVVDTVKRFTHSTAGDETRQVWEAGYFNDRDRDFDHMFELHLDELLAALRDGDDPPIHARAGRRALLLADACIRSFDEGRRVTV